MRRVLEAAVMSVLVLGLGAGGAAGQGGDGRKEGDVAGEVRPGRVAGTVDVVLAFEAEDGTPLEGKLTLPADREGAVPVVFYVHGAGPRSYDNPFRYRGEDGEVRVGFYLDFHARELAQRGVGFFRMSKRGCEALGEAPWMRLKREVFSGATPSVMLGDYAAGLEAVRGRDEVDAGRVVLLGSSEGTRIGPRLALERPEGIVGIAMVGFAADNARDTVVWQNTVGPWRNVVKLAPAAADGRLTKEDYDAAAEAEPALKRSLPFAMMDRDGDGVLMREELAGALRPRLVAILKAVEERNDEFLWQGLMNLSSAYLLEWWEAEANVEALLRLDVPLAIFHGELDGTCRVEGVREAEAAFKGAGKGNLVVRVYPEGDHDLDWSERGMKEGAGEMYREVFEWIEGVARGRAGGRAGG